MKQPHNLVITAVGLALFASAAFAQTLKFDGADSRVQRPGVTNFPTTAITTEFWVRTAGPAGRCLFSYSSSTADNEWTLFSPDNLRVHVGSAGAAATVDTGISITNGQWHHVAVSWRNTDSVVVVHVDGAPVYTGVMAARIGYVLKNGGYLALGQDQDSFGGGFGDTFAGEIDEFRVWDRVLTTAEIQQNRNRRLLGSDVGLVVYYPFDEGIGSTTLDASGHGVAGTLSGGPAWNALEDGPRRPVASETIASAVTDSGAMLHTAINPNSVSVTNRFEWGIGSTAVEFDGVDDFVYVENGPNLTNRSFSIEFWARRNRANAADFCLSLGRFGSLRDLLHVGFRSATQMTFAFFTDDLNTTVNGDDFAWHHWAFTYNSTTRQRRIYQDGLLVGQDIAGGQFVGTGPLRLGRYFASNSQNGFAGAMDEVRVWKDVVLTEATIRQWMRTEVNNTHPSFASLEAYWKFNEGTGRAAADSTGHGFTGQFVDNPVWAPGARPRFDQATLKQPVVVTNSVLNLDGVDDYVGVPDGVWFNGNFTVEFRALVRRYSNYASFLDFGNGPDQNNVLVSLSSGTSGQFQLWSYVGNSGSSLTSPNQVPLNRWVHLAVTLQGGLATLYMDGVRVAQGNVNVPQGVLRTNAFLGRPNWPQDTYPDVLMDEVRIWNLARSADQIRQFMNQSMSASEPALMLNYRFNEAAGNAVIDSRIVSPQNGTLMGGASRLPLGDVGATLSGLATGTVHHVRTVVESTNGASAGRSGQLATLNLGRGTALDFDGIDDYVSVAGVGGSLGGETTVEFWLMADSQKEQGVFNLLEIPAGSVSVSQFRARLPRADGSVIWDWGITPSRTLTYTPPVPLVGAWHHFALVSSAGGNYRRIYRNGILEAQASGADPVSLSGRPLTIGRYVFGTANNFAGKLDEFRIWSVARTEADIQRDLNERLVGNEPGLVAYYRMDEGAGLALLDSGPNGLHGLLSSGAEWLPSEAPVGLPLATTLAATGIGFGNATLTGSVNGEGTLPTTAWFEYGTAVAPVPGSAENQVSFHTTASTATSLSQINFNATPASVQSFTNIDIPSTLGSFWPGGPVDRFAARFTGRIYLPAAGTWTFYTASDDGTRLYLNGQLVVNNDGVHGVQERSGLLYLPAGHYALEVQYFESTSPAAVSVSYSGPGILKQVIPAEAFLRHEPIYTARTPVESLAANAVPVPITAGLANFNGNTSYHYRLVATNANGASYGADQTFTMLHPAALTAMNFDGINDQVIVNSAAAQTGLKVTTNATWEAWIIPTGPGSDANYGGIILNKEGEYEMARFPDGSIAYALALNTAQGYWTWINTGFVAPPNAWTHIALTYDGSMLRFYANGSLVHTNARTAGPAAIGDFSTTRNEFRIGGRQGATQFFNGQVDEVRVWNIVRSPVDIQQYLSRTLTGTEPGLLAYYRFDEGSGTTILDSGPRGYHGNTSGGPVGPPTHVASGAPLFQPQVATLSASPVLATTATLRGSVNPSGSNTVAYFEYGETIAYGSQTAPQFVGGGISTLPLTAMVTNLQPGTLYHFRAVAFSDAGMVVGQNQSFNTLVLGCGWPISSTVNGGKAMSPKHVVDAEGNAYVAGQFTGTATFKTALQPQGGSGTNAFIGKLARGADWLWATNVPVSASGTLQIAALAVDAVRSVYVAGQFSGTATFGTNVLTSAGTTGSDLFVAKLNSAGNTWLWARSAGGTNQPDSANALGVSPAGSVLVAGHFRGTARFGTNTLSSAGGSQDAFVAKLDSNGNWQWARAAGGTGTNDSTLALALNAAEDAYIAGRFQGTGSFGTNVLNAKGLANDTDLFVARLSTSGAWLLAARGGSAGPDAATGLAIDADGQVYLLGQFAGTADYNDTREDQNAGAGTRLFVAKLDANAKMLWYAQAGSGTAESIAVDGSARVYISGDFTTSTQFGDPPAFSVVSSGNSDVFVAQLNAGSGNWNWAQKIGASGSELRGSIGVDGEGGVVVSGSYQNTVQIGYVLLSSPNERDIFIARLQPAPEYEHNNFTIGQPIPVPAEAQDPSRSDGGARGLPRIEILKAEIPGSDQFNSFFWSEPEHKLFAIRPVTAVLKWPLTDQVTNLSAVATCVGRSFWPQQPQVHVAGAPVEIEGPGVGLGYTFGNVEFTTNNALAIPVTRDAQQFRLLQATNDGWSVLRFSQPGGEAVFEIVRTRPLQDSWQDEPAAIGTALQRPSHRDPTGKNGFVYFERAFYDGAGDERAYDRSIRSGPIIPVNTDTLAADDDLVVVWYHTNANTGIAWPDDPVRYLASWPSDVAELVLASGAGSGVLDTTSYPSKRVYDQPDRNQPGFNPNEEHAALYGDVLYALRNDLNGILQPKASDPYTLLKYRSPDTGEWAMKVFKVVATNASSQFSYTAEAGQQLLAPAPLSLLPLCAASNTWVSGPGFKDHQGRLYARAAGLNNSGTSIVTRYWYPLQPGFYYVDGSGQPVSAGTCVPWLDRLGGGAGTPVNVTYNVTWPLDVPTLQIGETLTTAKFGLPEVLNLAQAQVVYDEANPQNTNAIDSLVRLFDPLSERAVQLPADFTLPAAITAVNVRGRLVFADLPYAIRARLAYDPLNKRLSFGGLYDASGVGEPLLLINVLSERERDRIRQLSGDATFQAAVDALYDLTRNPNQVDTDRVGGADKALRIGLTTQVLNGTQENLVTSVVLGVGSASSTVTRATINHPNDQGKATNIVHEPLGDLPKALTAGQNSGSGFVTLVENNDSRLAGLPVTLRIIRVDGGPFGGELKVIYPDDVFDERLTLRHSADFAGEPEDFEFEWYYQADSGSFDPTLLPVVAPDGSIEDSRGWIKFSGLATGPNGFNDLTLGDGGGESSLLTIADIWVICRYRGYNINDQTNVWSGWVGGPGGDRAQLAEGWIKRVLNGLNPFEARVKDFHQAPTATYASMILQAGERYEGPIPFNPDPANLNKLGLIAAYETVLNRGRALSIGGVPPVNYPPANNALLLAAGRIADLYMLVGNEAFADASDPTIGLTTVSGVYGNLAPSIFSFQNQLDSLLEEELVLLRGRDDRSATVRARPVYNRLFWNFTAGDGEVAYSQNYNISDQNLDGFIDEKDARILYPQGHGDAWGHYLTAGKKYYELLRHPLYDWEPRPEFVLVAGASIRVDYLDERKFARAAAAKARVGAELVNLTYRSKYVEDPTGQWQGYKDTDPERAWGFDEWARRAGGGAIFDWVIANAILPATDPDTNHVGIQKIDRTTVTEMDEIAAQFTAVQTQVDKADAGLNPLGLATGVVPFDIDPAKVGSGQTHFDQIYQRALKALDNGVILFNHANTLSQNLRRNQDSVEQFSSNASDKERDYKNRLIEIFGYPYAGDVGSAGTYPSGYDGPDLYHYMYVNATDLTGERASLATIMTGHFKPLNVSGIGSAGLLQWSHFFLDDFPGSSSLVETNILQVSFPLTEGGEYGFTAPASWGQRRAPGRLQSALADILKAEAKLKQSLVKYNNLRLQIQDAADLLDAQEEFLSTKIKWKVGEAAVLTTLSASIVAAKFTAEQVEFLKGEGTKLTEAAVDVLPKSVGTASDVFAGVRGVIRFGKIAAGFTLGQVGAQAKVVQEALKEAKELTKNATNIRLELLTANYEIQQKIKALEQLIRQEAPARLELYELKEALQQAQGNYLNVLAQGERLMEERLNFRKTTAARTQEYRYQDMAFRIFQNDAIQKYRAQFDLAALYTFLAAKAYDYETCLLGTDSGAGRKFLTDIIRQRSLGQVVGGQPISGRYGLADPLARLGQNFEVYRGQLGFTTPETETGRLSLRNELMRLRNSSDADWRAELKKSIVPDLWAVPEFRRFCRPFAPESAGPQPGIVIRFPTTITFGLNYFGWPLGGGDSAYDPSRFATKVRSAGVWFTGYDASGLSVTPRVYLVPAGQDILRSPSGNTLETREWTVVDQKLPPPFTIGASDLQNPAWIPGNDSLSDVFADIRRFSTFRAYHDSGAFRETEATVDTRLIGRSVWNTDWMLIIPGGTFLFDPNQGLDTFINSVSDIKIFFQTYAYSGN